MVPNMVPKGVFLVLKTKNPSRRGVLGWSHLSQNQGYISTDYQIARCLRWFDYRTSLVRSSNQPKNHDFLTLP